MLKNDRNRVDTRHPVKRKYIFVAFAFLLALQNFSCVENQHAKSQILLKDSIPQIDITELKAKELKNKNIICKHWSKQGGHADTTIYFSDDTVKKIFGNRYFMYGLTFRVYNNYTETSFTKRHYTSESRGCKTNPRYRYYGKWEIRYDTLTLTDTVNTNLDSVNTEQKFRIIQLTENELKLVRLKE